MALCVSLPLVGKLDISKDGGGFVPADPMELFDHLEAKAEATRTESFEQTRSQISALSAQVAELAQLCQRPTDGAPSSEPGTLDGPDSEPGLRQLRKLLPPVRNEEDPQQGRFGGRASDGARELSADVLPSSLGKRWRKVIFHLKCTDGQSLTGSHAYFFLHDSFEPTSIGSRSSRATCRCPWKRQR